MASNGADTPADSPADAVRRCICSPTTHPGSFRCRLHRGGVGMPRSASCQQLGAPRPRSLCSGHHIRRAASQMQLPHPAATVGGGMLRSSSEHHLLRPSGVTRSASVQDLLTKK
ncbi:unnamed protein product [Urochloa decumbens]|uniref:Uncharacterized protein n=1 Tax=Urochloa decumbens TaxID=240449 RepID=A0ABC9CV97_9POAL